MLMTDYSTNACVTMALSESIPEPTTVVLLSVFTIVLRRR